MNVLNVINECSFYKNILMFEYKNVIDSRALGNSNISFNHYY